MYVRVTTTPDARKEKVLQSRETEFIISVKEAAERNLANARIRQILAEWYDVPMGKVRLISGHHSSKKKFEISLET